MKRPSFSILCLLALLLLLGCSGGEEQRRQLEALEQQNRSGEQMLNDSLAESLVEYFDQHGDANERMRAKYILGRTYYCLGELPRALETYFEAADCADTTQADCDYKVLSRIHAQSAVIFDQQIQPRSQLKELRLAEHYAWKGQDTLQAIECFAQQANAYQFWNDTDSVIILTEQSADKFGKFGRKDRATQMIGGEITSLLAKGMITKAKECITVYESSADYFDDNGNIVPGREIYYYIKGQYYLAINNLDSAEYMFRKELKTGHDLNNQIAGCKGLQKIYERKTISDSIAKYSNLGYILNDSAYSLSEMQNIQKLQASYNYNHNKQLADENKLKAQRIWNILLAVLVVILISAILSLYLFLRYKAKKENELKDYQHNQEALEKAQSELLEMQEENASVSALIEKKSKEIYELQAIVDKNNRRISDKYSADLEGRLDDSKIKKHLDELLAANPVSAATQDNLKQLKLLINEEIPCFYNTLNAKEPLRPIEYEICLLIRCHYKPAEVCKLMGRSDSYVANTRKGILLKVYGIKGSPKDLDERILSII